MQIAAPALTRRRFLRTLGQGALWSVLPLPAWSEQGDTVTISILHTTDLHGHILPTLDYSGRPDLGGLARCATQIRQWRISHPASVLVDIGDIFQGTEASLASGGAMMMRVLNALQYDAWVIGNHEFDWGMERLGDCLRLSDLPVLSGNARVEDRPAGQIKDPADPWSRLQPYLLKDVGGIRLAFIGLTTPGLSGWLPPELRRGFEILSPVEALRPLMREVTALGADAIILAGHMGLIRRDNVANQVGALTREFPQLAVCLGGHTHKNHPGEIINQVLYTQADHYGIYAGKVDLTFDRGSRRLVHREATTVCMDHQIALDPLVLSISQPDLAAADQVLARPVGELTELFSGLSLAGCLSDTERLIGSGIRAALRTKGVEIDAVVHGLFDDKPLLAGTKTVGDLWTLLPYENEIVTVELTRADLLALARDFAAAPEPRMLMGVKTVGSGLPYRITDLLSPDGTPLADKSRYRIALNSYDSQSGGERYPVVGRLVEASENQRRLYPMQIRDALMDFFLTRRKIGRSDLLV